MAHDSAAFRLESAKTEMAAPHSMLTYIPPGIHSVIAQYVYASDLPNYRLASRMLAEMGAHRLFGTLPFHCSSASLARIEVFKKAEHLNKYCHTLAWDTNFWETPHVCDLDEWTRYFTARASFPKEYQPMGMSEKYSKDQLAELAYSRHEWDRYLKNVRDERITGSCSDELMPQCFEGLVKLRKLRVINEKNRTLVEPARRCRIWCVPQGHQWFTTGERVCTMPPVIRAHGLVTGAEAFHIIREL